MANTGCLHPKIDTDQIHCAVMLCSNYRERCPLHALAQTGEACNLQRKSVWFFRVEGLDDPDVWPFTQEIYAKTTAEQSWWRYIRDMQEDVKNEDLNWGQYTLKDLHWVKQSDDPATYQLFMGDVATAYYVHEVTLHDGVIGI